MVINFTITAGIPSSIDREREREREREKDRSIMQVTC
jgi:hypothetical protein